MQHSQTAGERTLNFTSFNNGLQLNSSAVKPIGWDLEIHKLALIAKKRSSDWLKSRKVANSIRVKSCDFVFLFHKVVQRPYLGEVRKCVSVVHVFSITLLMNQVLSQAKTFASKPRPVTYVLRWLQLLKIHVVQSEGTDSLKVLSRLSFIVKFHLLHVCQWPIKRTLSVLVNWADTMLSASIVFGHGLIAYAIFLLDTAHSIRMHLEW